MSRRTRGGYFIRIAGILALLTLFASACDLPTAPRYPEEQEQDDDDDDSA
jgi:hypothetical protein